MFVEKRCINKYNKRLKIYLPDQENISCSSITKGTHSMIKCDRDKTNSRHYSARNMISKQNENVTIKYELQNSCIIRLEIYTMQIILKLKWDVNKTDECRGLNHATYTGNKNFL